jgi:hypothetical protein
LDLIPEVNDTSLMAIHFAPFSKVYCPAVLAGFSCRLAGPYEAFERSYESFLLLTWIALATSKISEFPSENFSRRRPLFSKAGFLHRGKDR